MIAAVAKSPEWQLDDGEARKLADAIAEVNRHYPLPVLNPGHASLVALGSCCLSLYVPRIMLTLATRKRAEKSKRDAARDEPAMPLPEAERARVSILAGIT